ncbi:hypothetical protein IE53DRAFT_314112 [Violaceomyces palustris]|uniref:Uncharacterized protein n=1 Tax=Violaceomyces palustris TaxID=1673888 RepID=A0ACD0NZX4_9BASI|nr:hypothetical protein IE53DRAFT_314112 [Violaceomyces palustris]
MRSRASGDGNFAPFNSRPEGPSGLPVAEVHGLGVRKSSQGTIHDITGAYRSSFSGASTESGVETAQTSRSRDGSAFPNEFSQAFEAPPPQLRGLFFQNLESRTFKLTARQQPRHGRLCGFGIKDKRPLDPLPIIQLEVRREDGEIDEDAHNSPNLVMQAFLKRVDTETGENNEVPLVAHMTERTFPWTRMLEGKLAASGHVVRDLDGSKACFFVFTDLSVRLEGVFILHFSLIVLGGESSSSGGIAGGKVVASIDSEPFTVYSPRRFPGMTESTELAKLLARQGVQVPIRNDVRKRSEEKAI